MMIRNREAVIEFVQKGNLVVLLDALWRRGSGSPSGSSGAVAGVVVDFNEDKTEITLLGSDNVTDRYLLVKSDVLIVAKNPVVADLNMTFLEAITTMAKWLNSVDVSLAHLMLDLHRNGTIP